MVNAVRCFCQGKSGGWAPRTREDAVGSRSGGWETQRPVAYYMYIHTYVCTMYVHKVCMSVHACVCILGTYLHVRSVHVYVHIVGDVLVDDEGRLRLAREGLVAFFHIRGHTRGPWHGSCILCVQGWAWKPTACAGFVRFIGVRYNTFFAFIF